MLWIKFTVKQVKEGKETLFDEQTFYSPIKSISRKPNGETDIYIEGAIIPSKIEDEENFLAGVIRKASDKTRSMLGEWSRRKGVRVAAYYGDKEPSYPLSDFEVLAEQDVAEEMSQFIF
jgi:hypothetical protein